MALYGNENMKTAIELKNMIFFAHHGVSEQETKVGNDFSVTVRFSADLSAACQSDNVEDTISYARVYDLVRKEMAQPSQLIEHAAFRILQKIKNSFSKIEQVEVTVAKTHPPLAGQMDYAAVTICE